MLISRIDILEATNANSLVPARIAAIDSEMARITNEIQQLRADNRSLKMKLLAIGQSLALDIGSLWREISSVKSATSLIIV